MSETYTTTYTSTYTEARAIAVMVNVLEDIVVLAEARLITYERAKRWVEDILYLMKAKVLNFFELQCYSSAGTRIGGYKYTVSDDGTLHENSNSGGIDPYDLPDGCKVGLYADIDHSKSNIQEVMSELANRGWGTNGSALEGEMTYERSYSRNNFGLKRYKIGL